MLWFQAEERYTTRATIVVWFARSVLHRPYKTERQVGDRPLALEMALLMDVCQHNPD
jgi:hypothetical protein